MYHGHADGVERGDEFVRRARAGRPSLYERYCNLLDPLGAFLVGGVGAFLGDLLFYPTPMFVSLVTHGLQAVVISFFAHHAMKKHPVLASGLGVAIGAVIMVVAYSFIYSTPEYAMLKLPYQILQAVVGAVAGMVLCWKCGIHKLFDRLQQRI